MTETITLSHDQTQYADKVALRRRLAAMERDRLAHNGASTNIITAVSMDVLGARTEAAGKIYLNPCKWNAYSDFITRLPDLENWIDVKGRCKEWHKLIVQKDDPGDWAYLLICGRAHPVYEIVGWVWGFEAKEPRFWSDPTASGRPAFFVPPEELRDPQELFDEVRRRQAEQLVSGTTSPVFTGRLERAAR